MFNLCMSATTVREFAETIQTDPSLQERVEENGLETVIEEDGHEFSVQEVEDAIREVIMDIEVQRDDGEHPDTVKALYTVTHVCTCKCTLTC